jgi:recombination associated protein RdgC
MFKNCTALKLGGPSVPQLWHASLADVLSELSSAEPDKTAWARMGFASPSHFGNAGLVFENERCRMLYVEKQERVLPGKVIKRAVAERAAEIERRDGHKPGRKIFAQLKEEVTAELLPSSHVKVSGTHVMITRNYLLIDSASSKLVEEIAQLLQRAAQLAGDMIEDWPAEPLQLRLLKAEGAAAWLKEEALGTGNGHFSRLDAAVVEGEARSVARFRDRDLGDEHVQEIILQGALKELAVAFRRDLGSEDEELEDLHCVVTDTLVFKRIKFSDIRTKQAEGEADDVVSYFDASTVIAASLLESLAFRAELSAAMDEDEL